MKSKMNIKSIVIMALIGLISLFFINMSLAANTGKVNVETANLRETANENAKILELLSMNQEVEIVEKVGDWCKVKTKGITGYVRQDLITINGEAGNATTPNNQTTEVTSQNQEIAQPDQNTIAEENTLELGKQKVITDTRLKIVPVINATNIVEVKKDEEVNVIEIVNGWACVETKTTKGWIRKEKLQKKEQQPQSVQQPENAQEPQQTVQSQPVQTASKTLYVNTTTVNLRKEANTSSAIVANLPVNTAVEVISETNGWSKVKVNGKEGYISSSLLANKKQETSRGSTTPRKMETNTAEQNKTEKSTTTTTPSGKGSNVVATAQQYIGSKYIYGGTTPKGFDCSGFTSYVYKLHGVSLSRTAAGQYSNGVAVNRSDLQPGDLVMFGRSGINHVAIYVGGGKIVHAANASRGVTIDTINSGYYNKTYVGARRIH